MYGAAGFGLLFSKAENNLASPLNTALYTAAPEPVLGSGEFKRLTADFSLGLEYPLAPGIFLYSDLRTSIPTSDYPSPFFHNQKNVPLPLSLNAGIRILFGSDD
jgi:hypothetical protein